MNKHSTSAGLMRRIVEAGRNSGQSGKVAPLPVRIGHEACGISTVLCPHSTFSAFGNAHGYFARPEKPLCEPQSRLFFPRIGSGLRRAGRLCTLLLGLITGAQGIAATKLTPETLFEWRYASDPQWSADGKRLVYVRTVTDKERDVYDTDIWLIDADRRERALTQSAGSDLSPRWSPDGSAIAFLSDRTGSQQVHLLPMDGGEARQITDIQGAITYLGWSPDGTRLAVRLRLEDERDPEKDPSAFVTERVDARLDGRAGYRPANRQRIAVVDLADPWPVTPRFVTDGGFDDGNPVWSVDGSQLYFSAVRGTDDDRRREATEVFTVPADASAPPRALTARSGPDDDPLPSPDGRWLAVTGFADREPPASYESGDLRLIDLSGREGHVELTDQYEFGVGDTMAGDANAPLGSGSRVQWSKDSRTLYFTSAVRGQVQLMRVDVQTAAVTPVTSFDTGEIREFDVSADGSVAAVYSRPDVPADLVRFSIDGGSRGAWRRLTALNATITDALRFVEYEELAVSASDGTPIQAWLVSPASLDQRRRYPLILYIHGGPHTMYGTNFFHEFQVLANAGYLVLIVNPRGSSGYGTDFGNMIQYRYPGDDYTDLMAVLDAVVPRRYVDAERLGVAGGSGGGLLTTWTVGHTDRFKAASAHRSVTNWYSFVGTADYNAFFVERWFRSYPWRDPEEYLQRSPISYVENVKTPVQLIHSDADYRTPLEQALQYFTALRVLDKPAELVVFPGESHGLSRTGKPSHRVERLKHVLRWFDKYLQPPAR